MGVGRGVCKWGEGRRAYRDDPEDALLCCPAVPDQGAGVEECSNPRVFSHLILWPVDQLTLCIVSSCLLGFPGHDCVGPSASEQTSEEVADGIRDIGQADDDGREVVGWLGEGGFKTDVQHIEATKGDAGVIHGYGDGWKPQVQQDLERVDKYSFRHLEPLLRLLFHDLL